MTFKRLGWLAGAPALLAATIARAQESSDATTTEAAAAVPTIDTGDTAWMLVSTVIVLLMTIPGLALFYGGMVRRKNVLATVMQSFATCALISLVWFVVGYSLVFTSGGEMNDWIGGLDRLFLSGMGVDSVSYTIPESVFMTFQMTFAIITPALIAGAFADRMKFSAMLWFMALWSLLVYAPVAHWVWGGGFLGADGTLDFAGGTVVHINAGVAGLVAALVIGKRVGYGTDNMAPHNLVLSLVGASLLWVGWFGFNAGSAVGSNGIAGIAMANTQIATAAAAVAWMFVEWIMMKKPSVLGIISGAVAGLVAITPACGFVDPMGALWIGLASGVICFITAVYVKRALGYDDSLDAFGIHGVGGAVGAVLTGVFATTTVNFGSGLIDGNAAQLWVQVKAVLISAGYCAIVTFIILKVIDAVIGLRVSKEVEIEGLDLHLHGETLHD